MLWKVPCLCPTSSLHLPKWLQSFWPRNDTEEEEWVSDRIRESWQDQWKWEGALEKYTFIHTSICILLSSSHGAKMDFCLCFPNASPPQKQRDFLSPPACLPWEQGDSCVRRLWDQGAECSRDKKNPHGRTSTLIYSHDRLRIVQQVGSKTRLINSCVWRKHMGLLAASGCMGPPSWCDSYPWDPLTPATVCCRW